MQVTTFLWPVFSLVTLTFAICLWMGLLRIGALRRREVSLGYFRLNRGEPVPARLEQVANNFRNLFELPVLFYLIMALYAVTGLAQMFDVALAWLFVASRFVHSFIHTTSNNVRLRFQAYLAGLLILLVMWAHFAWQLATS